MTDIFFEAKRVFETEINWLSATISLNKISFPKAVGVLGNSVGKIIVCGMGKSGHIARKIAATMTSTGTPSYFLHPAEGIHGDIGILSKGDVALVLSKSGDTPEIAALLPILRKMTIPVVAIVQDENSLLGRFAEVVLKLPDMKEACPYNLAPTASTTTMMALGDALAMSLLQLSGFSPEDFANVHPGGSLGRKLLMKVSDLMVKEPLTLLQPETDLSEAIDIMTKQRGLCLAVDKGRVLQGIFVYGDLGRLMKTKASIFDLSLADVMIKKPLTTEPDVLLAFAVQVMEEHGITSLVVVNSQQIPQGIIYLHDALVLGF